MRYEEKRKFIRLQAYHLAKYRFLSGEKKDLPRKLAAIKNIGGGGVCLILEEPVLVSSLIELKINFPFLHTPISTVAKIVWAKEIRGINLYEVGAQFVEIEELKRQMIEERIKFIYEKDRKRKIDLFDKLLFFWKKK
jgi:c-di-GMP-binding flagellar brake protein YcgR